MRPGAQTSSLALTQALWARLPAWWRFLFWNAAGGIAWATAVGLIAYYSGRAAADAIQKYGLYAAAVVAVIALGWIAVRRARR